MNTHNVVVIPGDGIGPEVVAATIAVVDAAGVCINWNRAPAGLEAFQATGSLLPDATVSAIERDRVAIKGPTGTPIGGGHRSINVALRERFDLYANVRPVKTFRGVPSRFTDVDLVIFRENLQDLYVGEERMVDAQTAEAISRITWNESVRIAEYAFSCARKRACKKVSTGHKANILKMTHGLWLDAVRAVAARYTDISYDEFIADNLAMQLVSRPERFECVLLPNFLGDIFSDMCAALVGGLGFAPGANIGKDYAIFEAVHGTAPDIAGKGIANPTALMLSAVLMLEHLGEDNAATRLKCAIRGVYEEGKSLTGDVDRARCATTREFTDAVIAKL